MSSVKFNVHLKTSDHGLPHPFKDVGVVADSLTGIHSATVKCLFLFNRSCLHKGFRCPHRGFKSGERGDHAACPLPIHRSWQLLFRTSCTVRLKCVGTQSCMYSIISAINSQIKCFRTHVHMDILSCFVIWNPCLKFVHIFYLHSVYVTPKP
jgi:hypothetical protein